MICTDCLREVSRLAAFGLCWACFHEPEVLAEYADEARCGGRPRPARPTCALPGTASRVRVMAARWDAGEQLFHPDDARLAEDDVIPLINRKRGLVMPRRVVRRRWRFQGQRTHNPNLRTLRMPEGGAA